MLVYICCPRNVNNTKLIQTIITDNINENHESIINLFQKLALHPRGVFLAAPAVLVRKVLYIVISNNQRLFLTLLLSYSIINYVY